MAQYTKTVEEGLYKVTSLPKEKMLWYNGNKLAHGYKVNVGNEIFVKVIYDPRYVNGYLTKYRNRDGLSANTGGNVFDTKFIGLEAAA